MKTQGSEEEEKRFIVDGMLGTLAKWLRLLGHDAVYGADAEDDEILEQAIKEKRIILTRDTRLLERREIKRRSVTGMFIKPGNLDTQLRQVFGELGLRTKNPLCVECNRILEEADRESARDRVPPFVFQNQTRFLVCPSCSRYYWSGTHWEQVEKEKERLDKG